MARRIDIPWRSIDELIEILEAERAALARQVVALRENNDPAVATNRAAVLICRYLVFGNADRAAKWANAIGWQMPGAHARGKRPANPYRDYTANDVYSFIDSPPPDMPQALLELAADVLKRGSERALNRR